MSSAIGKRKKRKTTPPAPRLPIWNADVAKAIQPTSYFRWKGAVDRLLAALLLVPGLPIIGGLMLLVRLTSRGPGIYCQTRVGRHGRKFTLYKLRSMRLDAEDGTGAVWSQDGDPRVTRLGRWLRRLHLDELPQLVNVLKGDMSLIGPRPERPEFVHLLAVEIPHYACRLAVLPGVTGLAQVNLPPDTDLNSVRRKLVLDLEYIRTAGLWMDACLFVSTFLRMLRLPAMLKALGLRRIVAQVDANPLFTDEGPSTAEGNGSQPTPGPQQAPGSDRPKDDGVETVTGLDTVPDVTARPNPDAGANGSKPTPFPPTRDTIPLSQLGRGARGEGAPGTGHTLGAGLPTPPPPTRDTTAFPPTRDTTPLSQLGRGAGGEGAAPAPHAPRPGNAKPDPHGPGNHPKPR